MTYKLLTMKILLTSTLILIACSASIAQDFDKRLLERFSTDELTDLATKDNAKLAMLNYALDNAISYVTFSKKKTVELSSIDMPEENATFVSLGFEIENQNQFFKINGSDKVLVIKSTYLLENELKNKK